MGGDYAPSAIVKGAVLAVDAIGADSRIVLFGDKARIEEILAGENCPAERFDIVHCSQVIGFDDLPSQAFVKKPDSSITVGFNHLKDKKIDGFASAGNTGAMMVGCMYTVKQIEGVIRPAISSFIPTPGGNWALLLDVGLNVDCKPDVLCQYAQIGSVFATAVLGIENPRVGLLNIGEEREKGNLVVKATYEMLEEMQGQINFVGNIEAKYLFTGTIANVIVCDGFVGNTILKLAEGFYGVARNEGVDNPFIDRFNYESIGGTPVLGINGNVIIAHGCSSPLAIKNMIMQTERTIKADAVRSLRETFVK
jgi:glycerol-3-phosphate acyltransferase PlsX